MGEVVDLILEGTLCEVCGIVFDDIIEGQDAPGYVRRCEDCEQD